MRRFSPLTRKLWRLLVAILGVYTLFCALLAIHQRAFLYLPMPGPTEPAKAGLQGYARHTLTADDGTPISYWESEGTDDRPLLFYFHGNGGGLHMFVPSLTYLRAQRFHVIALEYRSYPGSKLRATQTGITADALTLVDQLRAEHPKQPFVIWGYSLGTGVATQTAARRYPIALVLEAPFTAIVDRAQEMFPYLPVAWLMHDQYRSREVIARVKAPLFILHGEADRIVPAAHGKALYALARPPKTLRLYPGAGHLDLNDYGAYDDAVDFLRQALRSDQR